MQSQEHLGHWITLVIAGDKVESRCYSMNALIENYALSMTGYGKLAALHREEDLVHEVSMASSFILYS